LGTPAYVSPEQALGKLDELGERSDVYSLGAVLYELLTGRIPYVAITQQEVLEKVVEGPPRPVHEVEPQVPPELAAICRRAMAHEAEDRYASAKELADEIYRFLSGALVGAYRYTPWQRVRRFVARRKAVFATSGIALLVLLVVALFSYARVMNERDKAVEAQRVAEERLYETTILLAGSEIDRRRFDLADENLDLAPPRYRNWEWNYLKRKCHQDVMTYRVHTQPVMSVDVSPDKTRILTSSFDGTSRIIDLATRKTLRVFKGFTDRLQSAEFSPDGKRILIDCDDGAVSLLDADTAAVVCTLPPTSQGTEAYFTPDGSQFAASRRSEPFRFWNSSSGQQVKAFDDPEGVSNRQELSRDGERILSFENNGVLSLWDAESGLKLGVMKADARINRAVYSPSLARAVTASRDKTISLWDTSSFTLLGSLPLELERATLLHLLPSEDRVLATGLPGDIYIFSINPFEQVSHYACHSDMIFDAQFDASGSLVVTSSHDKTVRVSDLATGEILANFEGHSAPVLGAFFLPDQRRILSYSMDGTIKIWSKDGTPNDAVAVRHAHKLGANEALYSPDGKYVISFGQDFSAIVWNAATHENIYEFRDLAGQVFFAGWSPDSKRFVTASAEVIVNRAIDTGSALFRIESLGQELKCLRYSPTGDSILGGFADGIIRVWDAATGSIISTFAGDDGAGVTFALYTPDGTHIIAGYESGKLLRWLRQDGTNISMYNGDEGRVIEAAISPNGDRMVVTFSGGTAKLYDVQNGALLRILLPDIPQLWEAFYNSDGSRVAIISHDNTVGICDADGEVQCTLAGHDSIVYWVSFSPDGTRVLTASNDSTARVWDTYTGKELVILSGHTKQVRSGQFSPDGKTIVTTSWDGDLRFWSGAPSTHVEIRE
jgi:WD40 repeat protein